MVGDEVVVGADVGADVGGDVGGDVGVVQVKEVSYTMLQLQALLVQVT